jgi:hypothetical protein
VEKNIIGKKYDQDLPMWRSLAAKDVTPWKDQNVSIFKI